MSIQILATLNPGAGKNNQFGIAFFHKNHVFTHSFSWDYNPSLSSSLVLRISNPHKI